MTEDFKMEPAANHQQDINMTNDQQQTNGKPITPTESNASETELHRPSYAEAVTGTTHSPSPTGCLPTGTTRSHSPGTVTAGWNKHSDNLSPLEVDVATEVTTEIPLEPNTTTTGPLNNNYKNRTRNKWTKEYKLELYTCYIKALFSYHPTPATRGTFDNWQKRNLDKHPTMNPNTLNTARRYAERHTLTTREMETI